MPQSCGRVQVKERFYERILLCHILSFELLAFKLFETGSLVLESLLESPGYFVQKFMESIGRFNILHAFIPLPRPAFFLLLVSHLYQVLGIFKVEVLEDVEYRVVFRKNVLQRTLFVNLFKIIQMVVYMVLLDRVLNQFHFLRAQVLPSLRGAKTALFFLSLLQFQFEQRLL